MEYLVCGKGLRNLGNTCFFNSSLQCLNASKELVYRYVAPRSDKFPFSSTSSSSCMNLLLRAFFQDIRRVPSQSYNPSSLFSGVCQRNTRFRGFQQQDAHDLLLNLLDMLVQESDSRMKRTKEEKLRGTKKSIVEEVFGTYFINTVLCLECMRVSRTRDPTLDLSVTISFK